MKLYFYLGHPHRWVMLNRRDEVIDSGSCEELDTLPISKRLTHLIGVAPGSLVTIHKVPMPAKTRAKALAAIPYALEDSLATDIDELTFSMLQWRSGEEAVVAVLERRQMRQWQDQVAGLPRPLDALVPEQLLVPRHPQALHTVARKEDGTLLIRSAEFEGVVLDEDSLELWWRSVGDPHNAVAVNHTETARHLIQNDGSLISEWDIGPDFTSWLQFGVTPAHKINLQHVLSGARGGPGTVLKAAVIFLALSLLAKIALDGYEYYRLSGHSRNFKQQIVQVFKQTFPDVTRVVNPRLQMEQKLKALRSGAVSAGEFQFLMSAVAQALPQSSAVLEEVAFRNNEIIITCSTVDFAGLDNLKNRLAQDPRVRAELMSSGSRENRVSGRFKLVRA